MNRNQKTILLYGKTGVGKSSFGNLLFGKYVFQDSDGIDSFTNIPIKKIKPTNPPVMIIDTPGFSDSDGRDEDNLRKILEDLKQEKIDLILVILNFQEPRLDFNTQQLIKILCRAFPKNLAYHIGFVFTFYDHNKELKKSRGNGDPRLSRRNNYVPKIMDIIRKETNDKDLFLGPPIYFVENINNDDSTKEEVKLLFKFLMTLNPMEEMNSNVNFKYREIIPVFRQGEPQEVYDKEEGRFKIVERVYVKMIYIDYNGKKTEGPERLYSEKSQYKEKALEKLDEKSIKEYIQEFAETGYDFYQGIKFANEMNRQNNYNLSYKEKLLIASGYCLLSPHLNK